MTTGTAILFELTSLCNQHCVYCYNEWTGKNTSTNPHMSFHEIKQLFSQLFNQIPVSTISLIGGEPLLHPEYAEIISYLKEHVYDLSISTNGSLLNTDTIDLLLTSGVTHFEISLDTLDNRVYRHLTGSGDLAGVKSAIYYIKSSHALLTLSAVLTNKTTDSISELIDFAYTANADRVCLVCYAPVGQGNRNYQQYKPIRQALKNALSIANNRSEAYSLPVAIGLPPAHCRFNRDDYPHLTFEPCQCASAKWAIDPWGNLRTCELNHEIIGNLFTNRFKELCGSPAARQFKDNGFSDQCDACEQWYNCSGGCRFTAL